ncbi:hypothetical protein A162_16175 [Vibrio tasmaniensis 1F-155]|nr:hypothetical protein A162_16175 [Vibrio tasmaniensis 1F-155]
MEGGVERSRCLTRGVWVKQKTRQALGWKSMEGALASLHGREVWTMYKQEQIDVEGQMAFERFYALVI